MSLQPAKEDILKDLYLFYRYFIASNYANSVPAPHIKKLSRKLMRLSVGMGKSRLAVSMPPRHPLQKNTPVKTTEGWKTHGELKVGDYVFNPQHEKVKVIGVMPDTTVDNCFVFSNGDKIISGDEHLWKFYDQSNDITRLFTTQEIMNRELFPNILDSANFKIITNDETIELIDAYKVQPTIGNCITIDSTDGMYLVGENSTPTHNSKSSMVTLAFPLWLIFRDPSLNILIVNNSASLSEKFGIQIREYIRNIGPYFGVFLSDVKRSSTHIMFTNKNGDLYDGSIRLVGASGSITGQDADYLVIDDPYFGFDDITPSQLRKKIEWFQTIILQRLEPTSKLIILHTRWHPISKGCPVYTSNRGWIRHGDLRKGDRLIHPSGSTTRVVSVHPTVPVDNCFVFSNGDTIISGDEHLWKVQDYNENDHVKLLTSKRILKENTFVGKSYLANFKIPYKNKLISLIDKYKVQPVPGNCITVDNPDGMYMVGENFTPTHNSNDLIGYVRESDPDNYDFVEFPALDENNTPLWKQRFSADFLLDLKKNVGERVFQSVYQQQPIDATSDFFNMKKLKSGFPEDYVQESIARGWDTASGDVLSNSDFTAGVKMARFGDYAVILDLVHGRFGSNTRAMIQNTAFMDSPTCHVVIETGVGASGDFTYQEWSKQLQGFMVARAKVSGDKSKVDRATPLQNAIEDGKVYVAIEDGPTRQAFYDELNSFPAGEHDDITDATSHVYNYLFVDDVQKPVTAKFGVVYL